MLLYYYSFISFITKPLLIRLLLEEFKDSEDGHFSN